MLVIGHPLSIIILYLSYVHGHLFVQKQQEQNQLFIYILSSQTKALIVYGQILFSEKRWQCITKLCRDMSNWKTSR